jgi:hypothetical protein
MVDGDGKVFLVINIIVRHCLTPTMPMLNRVLCSTAS